MRFVFFLQLVYSHSEKSGFAFLQSRFDVLTRSVLRHALLADPTRHLVAGEALCGQEKRGRPARRWITRTLWIVGRSIHNNYHDRGGLPSAAAALRTVCKLIQVLSREPFSLAGYMRYRSLGNTGLLVSEIGIGCASYWGKTSFSEAEAVRLIHTAVDRGVTFFDTGASYSGGNAEPRLGRALRGLRQKHDIVVATKAGSYTDQRGKRRVDFSPDGGRRTVEASLVRLGLDAIPLLHLHGPEI